MGDHFVRVGTVRPVSLVKQCLGNIQISKKIPRDKVKKRSDVSRFRWVTTLSSEAEFIRFFFICKMSK